jgi:excisionase family DNA binding protein
MSEITLAEAATQLGLAPSTLRAQVAKGRLRARLAGKTYLVTLDEVARYGSQSRGRRGRPRRRAASLVTPTGLLIDRGALAHLAQRWGIRSLAAFGSVARGEAHSDSDVDLVMELDPSANVGLFQHAQIAEELAALFGRPVDLVTWNALRPRLLETVRRDAVDLLAR